MYLTNVFVPLLFAVSAPFRWTKATNSLLLREVFTAEPFMYKVGSKEAGQKWSHVADKLNWHDHFKDMPRDQRSVREHFNKLLAEYKRKKNKEEKGSGITPDPPTENEQILEDIIEMMNSAPIRVEDSDSKKQEIKRKEALVCRDKAMTTWAKAGRSNEDSNSDSDEDTGNDSKKPATKRGRKRRSRSDAFQYLAEKTSKDAEVKKEEMELHRQQLQLQAEQMKLFMQSQSNTQNLIVALLQKISQ